MANWNVTVVADGRGEAAITPRATTSCPGRVERLVSDLLLRVVVSTRVQCELALAGLHGPSAPAVHIDPHRRPCRARAQVLLDRAARTSPQGVTDEALLAALLVDDDPGLTRAVLHDLGIGRGLACVLTHPPS